MFSGQLEHIKIFLLLGGIVLLVVGSFFSGFFKSGTSSIELEQTFNAACDKLRVVYNCDKTQIENVTVWPYGKSVTALSELCRQKGLSDDVTCARACGCPS